MKFITSILFFILIPIEVSTAYLSSLAELNNPGTIEIAGDELYVLDNHTVHVYSLKNFKQVRKFGKSGEGPGELIPDAEVPIQMYMFNDMVFLNSTTKIVFLSRTGELIKEKKLPFFALQIFPIKANYLALKLNVPNRGLQNFCVMLFDSNLNELKTLYSRERIHPLSRGKINVPLKSVLIRCAGNKIFVVDQNENFIIHIFDYRGNRLEPMEIEVNTLRVSDAFKNRAYEWLKSQPAFRANEELRKMINFPKLLPAVQNFTVNNQKISVQTYGTKADLSEFVIIDTNTRTILEKLFLPGFDQVPLYNFNTAFTIKGNKIYYLVENLDAENWELHVRDIR